MATPKNNPCTSFRNHRVETLTGNTHAAKDAIAGRSARLPRNCACGKPMTQAKVNQVTPGGECPPGMPKRYGAKRCVQPRTVFRTLTQYVTFFGFEE